MDLKTGKCESIDLKWPKDVDMRPREVSIDYIITRKSQKDDELLTFGFVHECYKKDNMKKMQELPFYLIQLIAKWIFYNYLHIVFGEHETAKRQHFKILVDHVFDLREEKQD